ncbi:MAG: FAD-dependent oxidoreductase [Clostridiales bacterium]|nr:FAD-dependent oxidoreductase [Clostridiales bacterium]
MSDKKNLYDLIIIGAGSAGLTAGIYAGRAKLNTLIIDREEKPGGQIRITSEVVNYPGIISTDGPTLSDTMKKQAENFGVKFINAAVDSVDFKGDIKKVVTNNGDFEALSVIIASGATPRRLGFPGEEEYQGRGVGFCATCDGEFFTGMDVFVIGAGFAAAEESLFLTRFAKKVTIIAREPEFTCSKTIADKVKAHPKIEVKFNTEIVSASGDSALRSAKFINNKTQETWEYRPENADESFGIFIFVGYIPISEVFKEAVALDKFGYIPTDENMQTNVEGVYAAGDIRPKALRQLVTAVSDGAIAATNAERYIEQKKEQLGIKTEEHETSAEHSALLDDDLKEQIKPVLEKFENNVKLKAILDESDFSSELKLFLEEFVSLGDKVSLEFYKKGDNSQAESEISPDRYPVFAIYDNDDTYTGVSYYGIPGGHEINSFIISLYNTAGPGQAVDEKIIERIKGIDKDIRIQVAVSLSCTFCPQVVMASQLIAIKNPKIKAEMIDAMKFNDFRTKHKIMSVPAVIINDGEASFGAKSLEQLVDMIDNA